MTQEEKEFEKKYIEQIPPWDMKAIDNKVSERVRKVFESDEFASYQYAVLHKLLVEQAAFKSFQDTLYFVCANSRKSVLQLLCRKDKK